RSGMVFFLPPRFRPFAVVAAGTERALLAGMVRWSRPAEVADTGASCVVAAHVMPRPAAFSRERLDLAERCAHVR
ncbi:hypothetical protein, partial [Paracoccus sp. (in: a-proteobacteria)]|uniref:hypothetical protein n=1 Tax=Paracoccus sp. TaxID=267 RepID=UPI00289B6CDC